MTLDVGATKRQAGVPIRTRFAVPAAVVVVGLALPSPGARNPSVARAAPVHSASFAGYRADLPVSEGITRFTGWVSVPKITCPPTGSQSMSVRIQLSGDAGPGAGLTTEYDCNGGQFSLNYPSTYPTMDYTTGHAATTATSSVFSKSGFTRLRFAMIGHPAAGATTLRIRPQGGFHELNDVAADVTGLLSLDHVEVGVSFAPAGAGASVTPIPAFTRITFGDLRFDGAGLTTLHPARYDMYDGLVRQVSAGAVSADGSFRVTFRHR